MRDLGSVGEIEMKGRNEQNTSNAFMKYLKKVHKKYHQVVQSDTKETDEWICIFPAEA